MLYRHSRDGEEQRHPGELTKLDRKHSSARVSLVTPAKLPPERAKVPGNHAAARADYPGQDASAATRNSD